MEGRAKWDSWNALDDMESVKAMELYVELVSSITEDDVGSVDNKPAEVSMGNSVSTLMGQR